MYNIAVLAETKGMVLGFMGGFAMIWGLNHVELSPLLVFFTNNNNAPSSTIANIKAAPLSQNSLYVLLLVIAFIAMIYASSTS